MIHRRSIAVLVVLLLAIGCGATQNAQDTPLQTAQKQYVAASVAYEAAQNVVVAARTNHQISDDQWHMFAQAQSTVATTAPVVRSMLDAWKTTGAKPTGLDAALALLQGASQVAVSLQNGVHP